VAHSKSALKRWRQNEAHRARNKGVRTAARSAVKKAHEAIEAPDGDAAAAIREASSILDRAAKRNVVHKNAASRHKSRLMRQANRASTAVAEPAPAKRTRKTAAKPRTTSTRAKAPAKAPAKPRAKKATSE
jgi:small subunit ribosomal protein S20